jgi:hypothetical protein
MGGGGLSPLELIDCRLPLAVAEEHDQAKEPHSGAKLRLV